MKTNKKTILLVSFVLISFRLMAPVKDFLTIVNLEEKAMPYTAIMNAVAMVETKGDTLAYNPVEQAAGIFQIRPIRLQDYNQRTGKRYTQKDLFKYNVSKEIFLYYAALTGPYDQEKIARRWNGSGHKTYYYWQRVKRQLGQQS